MDLAMTFSGTLFLSIAMIDVIPQAIASFDDFFKERSDRFQTSSLHQGKLPLTMIIAMVTMLIIMALDKIVMGHSHDHQYQISFTQEPRKKEDGRSSQVRAPGELAGEQDTNNPNPNIGSERQEERKEAKCDTHQINWKPFILQAGMSIHAFF